MSYKAAFSRKDRIASRFLAQAHAAISKAAQEARDNDRITQVKISRELDVDKSTISRILKGVGNPTLRTVGELSAALGYRPELVLNKIAVATGSNFYTAEPAPNTVMIGWGHTSTSPNQFTAPDIKSAKDNQIE